MGSKLRRRYSILLIPKTSNRSKLGEGRTLT
jgi:hypothetical protein